MSSPRTPRRSLSTAEWPIDPALENTQPPSPSPPRRVTRSSQAFLASLEASQNEKEDELFEIEPEAGPSRPRRADASQPSQATQPSQSQRSRRRRRSSSPEAEGADVIDPPAPKRKKTQAEKQQSYAQGWETRRQNIWAERVLPTYSTGLETDYSDLPPDFLLDSISQHAGRYFRDRGLMKNPKKWWLRRIQPNKKRKMLEQGGAVARVLRESGITPSRLSIDSTAEVRGEGAEGGARSGEGEAGEEGERTGEGEGNGGEGEEESDRVLRPRTSTGSSQAAEADGAEGEGKGEGEAAGSGSDTDASEDAYNPEKDVEPDSDDENPTTSKSNPKSASKPTNSTSVQPAPAARTQELRDEAAAPKRRRGPYIRRDMRNAIQGAGLLALGVLVEEMIRAQLAQAGYAPRERDRRASTAVESDVEPISDPEEA